MNLQEEWPEMYELCRNSALHRAAFDGDTAEAERALALGAPVNGTATDEATPLYVAALAHHASMAQLLLRHGADQRVLTRYGPCPLDQAVRNGAAEVVCVLLQQQVSHGTLYCADHIHIKPIDYALRNLRHGRPALFAKNTRIASLLLAAGAVPRYLVVTSALVDGASDAERAATEVANERCRVACTQWQLESAAFALVRHHLIDVALPLAALDLPALVTTLILGELAPPGASLRMHHLWQVATIIKHAARTQ